MIATLEGTVSEKTLDTVILDVRGVGYEVFVASEDHGVLSLGKLHKVFVYEHIRETAHDLYGFVSKETKQLFEQLLSVNGVGPKMALSLLSIGSVKTLSDAIANQDVAFVKQASGVGKRVAERIVVDLKDKIGVAGVAGRTSAAVDDAVQGLMALGYSQVDATTALSSIDTNLSTEERIKQALKEKA